MCIAGSSPGETQAIYRRYVLDVACALLGPGPNFSTKNPAEKVQR
jgi:hypothetical protein